MTPADTLRASEAWAKFCIAVLAELPPEAAWTIDVREARLVGDEILVIELRTPVQPALLCSEYINGPLALLTGGIAAALGTELVCAAREQWEFGQAAAIGLAAGLSACQPTTSPSS